jgi:hypothetical protein
MKLPQWVLLLLAVLVLLSGVCCTCDAMPHQVQRLQSSSSSRCHSLEL